MALGQVGVAGGPDLSGVPLERPMLDMVGFAGWWKRQRWTVVTITEMIVVMVVWDISIARLQLLNPVFFPAPSGIVVEMQKMIVSGELWKHLIFSLRNLFVGYFTATMVGIILGLFIGASRTLDRLWTPIIWSLYSTPMIIIRPLLILWFGFAW